MSDVTINIHGGNKQILPNATEAVQNFYGIQPTAQMDSGDVPADSQMPEADRLDIYIEKGRIHQYIARIGKCTSALPAVNAAIPVTKVS